VHIEGLPVREAETALLGSCEALKVDPGAPRRLTQLTVERLIQLYDARGMSAKANRFRSSLTVNTPAAE